MCLGLRMRLDIPACLRTRTPHIGEYATKTNAIRTHRQTPATPGNGRWQAFDDGSSLRAFTGRDLIRTSSQALVSLARFCCRQLRTVRSGVVHHRTTVFLDVVGTGLLLLGRSAVLLLLGHGSGGDRQRQQSSYEESFTHCVPLFLRQRFQTRIAHGISGQTISKAAADCSTQKRWQMRPNLRRPSP